jgi:hypothetical protein
LNAGISHVEENNGKKGLIWLKIHLAPFAGRWIQLEYGSARKNEPENEHENEHEETGFPQVG